MSVQMAKVRNFVSTQYYMHCRATQAWLGTSFVPCSTRAHTFAFFFFLGLLEETHVRTFVVHVVNGLSEGEGDDARHPQALQYNLAR